MAHTRARASWRCSRCAGRWACRPASPPSWLAPEGASTLELRVEPVAQTVAEEIEGKDRERDGNAGKHDHPGGGLVEVGACAREHQPPSRCGFCDTETQE